MQSFMYNLLPLHFNFMTHHKSNPMFNVHLLNVLSWKLFEVLFKKHYFYNVPYYVYLKLVRFGVLAEVYKDLLAFIFEFSFDAVVSDIAKPV